MNYSNDTLEGEDVLLDGAELVDCRFVRCRLIFRGTEMPRRISGCRFLHCKWVFEGPAQNAMTMLGLMYHEFGDFGRAMVNSTFDQIRKQPP
jgi:hypothetical protein